MHLSLIFLLQNSGYSIYKHSWELCNSSWCEVW